MITEVTNKLAAEEVITIPKVVTIFTDKQSGFKSVGFRFDYPDGIGGVLTLTRLVKMGWIPSDSVESITIKFK